MKCLNVFSIPKLFEWIKVESKIKITKEYAIGEISNVVTTMYSRHAEGLALHLDHNNPLNFCFKIYQILK